MPNFRKKPVEIEAFPVEDAIDCAAHDWRALPPWLRDAYEGVRHVNDTRSCTYTPLKGVISYQENADDWRAIAGAYSRAVSALLRFRDGDEGVRNP